MRNKQQEIIWKSENEPQNEMTFLKKEGSIFLLKDKEKRTLKGESLLPWESLLFTIENLESESLTLDVQFHSKEPKETLTVSFSILPASHVTVPLQFELLKSQELFPERTKGRLRMMVSGKPMKKEEVVSITLVSRPFYKDREIRIHSLLLSNEKNGKIHHPRILIDERGQWKQKGWEGKIESEEELKRKLSQLLQEAETFNFQSNRGAGKYYGTGEPFYKATGWFRTEKIAGKWWFITPDGYRFFSAGVDGINPGTETGTKEIFPYLGSQEGLSPQATRGQLANYGIQNLITVFGEESWWQAWFHITRMYLHKWGMNTIGNWSSTEFIKKVQMPYVLPLDSVGVELFPFTCQKLFRDFPDVFAEEYSQRAQKYAENLLPFRDDPYMIGYFMRNEPAWGFVYNLNIAEEMLANSYFSASKKRFIRMMEEKYQNISDFNQAWKTKFKTFLELEQPLWQACRLSEQAEKDLKDFSKILIERYISVPAKACKNVDPYHLNLGMRYAYVADSSMLSGARHFDVFSINSYQLSPVEKIEEIAIFIDKPVMIGEFHFGAIDRGPTATGIRGVVSQSERGAAYRYYMEQAASHPAFVGAHYFMLNDQSCLGRSDGENYQIGFIDICMQEYKEMTEVVAETNKNLATVHTGGGKPVEKKPQQIPPIFC